MNVSDLLNNANPETWQAAPFTQKEKVHTAVFDNSRQASRLVAREIADLIKAKAAKNEYCVLGLATGSSPKGVYEALIDLYRSEGLSFAHVITFNLDEYYPIAPDALQSYVNFMNAHLFNYVDIKKENIHIPDGTLTRDEVEDWCRRYEAKIDELGGLDFQLLGIGRTGHIGFNEPGSSINSLTRLVTLDHITRMDAASDFFGEENVPRKAITMGIGSIFKARRVVLMAWGEAKAPIVRQAVEESPGEQVPAAFLQQHPNATFFVDEAAGAALTRLKAPWTLGFVQWTEDTIRKAVIWLSETVNKPVLKLTDRDYSDHGMGDLMLDDDTAYNINIRVFNWLQSTITGWPGGKPNADDSKRPERSSPFPKRVLIFSPHPDDDVISMGGTFIRLVDQGHEVHVAFQTSGNIAVFDDDVLRLTDFFRDLKEMYHINGATEEESLYETVKNDLNKKSPGDIDSDLVRSIKGLIRKNEAKAASRFVGIPDDHVHFLNLPFYETGKVKKKPLEQEDIDRTTHIIKEIQPHQIYAAGDLSDPHGTHRVCLDALFKALEQLRDKPYMEHCWLWLYRGAWQEWAVEDIEMAVPLSPDELLRKRKAIFKHQSQKDTPLFPGHDKREFWQRAEDRNQTTAQTYDQLGLAEYEAIEAFKRYHY